MLPQVDGSQDLQIKTVYYAGTSTLRQGDALAYDTDDTNAPVTTTTLDRKNLRGRRVVNPATAVLNGFAGLVAPQSAGVVGPAYVDIIVPRKGDMCYGFTSVNCTKNSSLLGITNAGARTLVAHSDATVNLDLVGVAMETIDRSSTNGLVLLRFA